MASLTLPLAPLQVLRRGDPAEGGNLPADANGEGGRAHQGGSAWASDVSMERLEGALVGRKGESEFLAHPLVFWPVLCVRISPFQDRSGLGSLQFPYITIVQC